MSTFYILTLPKLASLILSRLHVFSDNKCPLFTCLGGGPKRKETSLPPKQLNFPFLKTAFDPPSPPPFWRRRPSLSILERVFCILEEEEKRKSAKRKNEGKYYILAKKERRKERVACTQVLCILGSFFSHFAPSLPDLHRIRNTNQNCKICRM